MGFKDYKVRYYSTDSSSPIELTNVISVRVTRTLNAKSNGVELLLDNYGKNAVDASGIIFKQDEVIKIYAADGDVDYDDTSHLIGVYVILNPEVSPDARTIKLICGDKTYNMLSKIYIADRLEKVDLIIENIVQTVNEDGTSITPVVTNIASTTSDSSAFPIVRYTSVYKTAYEAISELSQPDYTGDDRPYMFWFDENDHFYWEYPSQSTDGSLTHGVDPVISMKINKAESEAVAMLIYDAGVDKNGETRLGFYVDPNAGSIKNRMKFQPMTDISRDLTAELTRDGTLSSTSNDDFVALLDARAIARARAIIQMVGTGLWEASITVSGSRYTPGGLYNVTAIDHGFPTMALRVEKIVHTMDKNGWETTLSLSEDVESI